MGLAGASGAGKSTLIHRVLDGKLPVVNTDDLAAAIDLERRNTPSVQLAAGHHALAARAAHLAAHASFVRRGGERNRCERAADHCVPTGRGGWPWPIP